MSRYVELLLVLTGERERERERERDGNHNMKRMHVHVQTHKLSQEHVFGLDQGLLIRICAVTMITL